MSEQAMSEPIPSVKDLASSEPSLRRAALKATNEHIAARSCGSPLTPTQCLQLWRGLYVALYMHDSKNALSVQNLTKDLAGTLSLINTKDVELEDSGEASGTWLDSWTVAFWETMCREWASIDQWRMNKVLLLIRLVLRETFKIVLSSAAAGETESTAKSTPLLARQITVLEAWPLSPRSHKVPDGLRLHVLDIWAEELIGQTNAVQQETQEERGVVAAARSFMAPVTKASKDALSKGVRTRAKEAIAAFDDSFPPS